MRKRHYHLGAILVLALAVLGLGDYTTNHNITKALPFKTSSVSHHVSTTFKGIANPTTTAPTGAKVDHDATDKQLLALQFDAQKYPENYANLGKTTLTDLQVHDALQHNNEHAWYRLAPLDNLGRSGAGEALVTYDSVSATAKMKRPPFAESADPTGYRGNNRIAELTGYRGYFYNRSHTLAWSLIGNLGGPDTSQNRVMQRPNLTTGTRAQNVGTNGRGHTSAGGMAYAETAIREFVRARPNIPVYYVVTPLYERNEIVPRGTHVQAVSATDKGTALNINIYVFNTQPGAQINYQTGAWTQN